MANKHCNLATPATQFPTNGRKFFLPGFPCRLDGSILNQNMIKKAILTLLTALALTAGTNAQILINEVYAGGGSNTAGASYTRDYVELYNTTAAPFSLAGFSLQYAPASSNFTGTIVNFGAGSIIGASDYLSIYTGSAGTAGATLTAGTGAGFLTYISPTSSASLSNSNGSVRLINTANSTTMDLIGYGTVTVGSLGDPKSEGTAASSPTNTASSLNRTGFVDTNNNSADFTNMAPTPNGGMNSVVVAVAPEPSTWAVVAGAAGLLILVVQRRNRLA